VDTPPLPTADRLERRLRTPDAVVIGVGSMVGAGIFSAFAPAAQAAGSALLVGLALAGLVAWCNATSSAQLAAQYPSSGGTYLYGRERLGEWPGYLAGWGFVVGKTASCAAMALTFATYAVPAGGWWARGLAVAAVVALTAVNLAGITRTARVTRVLVTITLGVLAVWTVAVVATGHLDAGRLGSTGWTGWTGSAGPTAYGVLQSAGLLFFAFAGYARIATLGEEVVDPARTIPRAVLVALGLALVLYAVVAVVALLAAGAGGLAATATPLAHVADVAGQGPWLGPLVRVGAAVAALGALLGLLAGIGRTGLAMARHGDLPRRLARVERVQLLVAAVVVVLVLVVELREVIGFSSFGVLVYYAVANAAAWTQEPAHRRWPRPVQVLGLAGCVVLVATLPWGSVVAGVATFALGAVWRVASRLPGRRA
jgi:basic amino acid/polyamine antiporter, APA family